MIVINRKFIGMKKSVLVAAILFCFFVKIGASFQGSASLENILTYSQENNTDLIIFSKDRPLQLFAYLKSLHKNVTALHKIYVLYRTSNQNYEFAYQEVKKKFFNVDFVQDGVKPFGSFRASLLHLLFEVSKSPYIMFGVDDIIVTDFINIRDCVIALRETNAYGFYLRFGKNITQCYVNGSKNCSLPPLKEVKKGIYAWQFKKGVYDWNFPNTVDMTIYNKQDLKVFELFDFYAPNSLEARWSKHADKNKIGLCYEFSKMVNIPLNKVQVEDPKNKSRNMNALTAEQALTMFMSGMEIDSNALFKINNKAPHMAYDPVFKKREVV